MRATSRPNATYALPGTLLGRVVGTTIIIDVNAAGWGWYLDDTPWTSGDLAVEAAGRVDLLTVLLHEFGHVLGLRHGGAFGALMYDELRAGVRLVPYRLASLHGPLAV